MKPAVQIVVSGILLLGLPLAGVWITGQEIAGYLEFPPRTQYVAHAPFSWPVFTGLATLILATTLPFVVRVLRTNLNAAGKRRSACNTTAPQTEHTAPARAFPWWGGLGLGLSVFFWIIAWTRFEWMKPLQPYTFAPQWIAFIVVLNALTLRLTGRCLLTHEPRFLLLLFPASALFWWFFEYLNRFVQNWYYVGCDHFTPLQYAACATLCFSTVLPAVLSTEEWLAAHARGHAGLKSAGHIRCHHPKIIAAAFLLLASAGLLLIGAFPDLLYPLLWVAPLMLLICLNGLAGRPSFFPEVRAMDFRRIYRLALAALLCGLFWELWNWKSLAKWIYSVPFVHRFQLFEMPLLGYAGYLPFGLECAVVAELIRRHRKTYLSPARQICRTRPATPAAPKRPQTRNSLINCALHNLHLWMARLVQPPTSFCMILPGGAFREKAGESRMQLKEREK